MNAMRLSLALIFIYILFGSITYSYAQVKTDTLTLGEITVESTRIRKPIIDQPVQVTSLDSNRIALQFGNDLGDLLSSFTSIYIRSNGPGAASVISQRGLGGDQTRVLWEGMPLNHQMLGVTDLSLVPATLFTDVEVTSGTGSAHYGSGIGGTVYLKNRLASDHISLSQSLGSYGNRITKGEAGYKAGSFSFKVAGSAQENENAYLYYDENTNSIENRKRGALTNQQLMGLLEWRKQNAQWKSSLWWSRVDHDLTENIYGGPGTATQFDESIRWVNKLKYYSDQGLWEGIMYAAATTLDYLDPNKDINSLSESRVLNTELSYTYFHTKDLELRGMLTAGHSEVETNNYTELKSRDSFSGSVSASVQYGNRLKLYPAFRVDHYGDFGTALSPSLGVNYSLIAEQLSIRALAARNFRAPTFNDLYWPAGGNEELKAERGIKTEIGLMHTGGTDIKFKQQLSVYLIRLYDGIKWQPDALGDFKAQNIQEITSRSMEWSGEASMQIGKWNIGGQQSVSYTRAYFSEERFIGDQAVGNQLPYVPFWKYNGSILLKRAGFTSSLTGVYIDKRFTTEQASPVNSVDSYLVFDATVSYSRDFSKTRLSLTGKLNNLFNERYDVVRFYPMPLRNFLINVTLTQKF